jgi:hypothetical protein
MRPNLDSLNEEIQQYLEAEHFVVFRAASRITNVGPQVVYWDSDRYPDFRLFLDCAAKLGIRLVTFHQREFTHAHREDALDRLEETDLPRDEKRELGRRIEDLALYEGFLCAIELGFDYESRLYVFELETDWYEDWHNILDEVEEALPPDFDEGGDDGPYPGYFSNN